MKILWTDGSAMPNPGKGGFAVIEEFPDGTGEPVALGREENSTNIRMEGLAMIAGIKYAIESGEDAVEIHSDSEFWINVATKWAPSWERSALRRAEQNKMDGIQEEVEWRKGDGSQIKNLDIVKELYGLCKDFPVKFVWVRGHAGTILNEMADRWANKARTGATIKTSR